MAGLTEEDIKNLGALSKPTVKVRDLVPNPDIEIDKVETLGGTLKKEPSRISGKLEPGYGRDVVSSQDSFAEKALAASATFANDTVGPLFKGFNRAVAFLPDAALNAITTGFNLATGSEIDKDILLRIFNSNDFESQKVLIPYILNYGTDGYVGRSDSDSAFTRYSGAVGEGLGMAVPVATASTLYAKTAQALPKIGQYAQNTGLGTTVLDTITKPFVKSPVLANTLEGGLSAVSAVGVQAEEDIFGTKTGLGALLPFSAPAIYYAVKSGVVTPVSWVGKKVFTKGADTLDNLRVEAGTVDPKSGKRGDEAKVIVDKQLQDAALGNEENIARAIEIETTLQPFAQERIVFSPAEATLDAPTLKTQAGIEQTATPEFARKNLARKENILKSISSFISAKFTGNAIDDAPLMVFDAAKNKYTLTVGRIDAGEKELSTKLSILTNSDTGVYPKINSKTDAGQEIRQVVSLAHAQAKSNAEALANNLNINKADQVASMDSLDAAKTAVREAVTSREGAEAFSYAGLNKTVKGFIESDKTKITFQDWKMFRDQVSSQIGKAFATNNKSDQRSLAILGKTLDDMGEAFGRTNVKFKEFQNYYDQNVIRPFETSQVVKILAKGRGGAKDRAVYYLADEQVAGAFLKDSNTAKQFMTLFGDNPKQLANIKASVLDAIRTVGVVSGEFKPNAINKYMNTNREVLTELGLYSDLINTQSLIKQVTARQASLETRRKIINQNSMYSAVARAMKVENPEKLIDDLLKSPKLAREVSTKLGRDPEVLEAFRAAVMQKALGKDPNALVDPYAFKKFLVENHRALDNVFDKSHIDNMYLIADAAERAFATPIVAGKGLTSEDVMSRFAAKFGATVPGSTTRFIALNEGRIGQKAVGAYFLARGLSARSAARADALFKEMMFDPDVAKALVKEGPENFSITPESNRQINSILFNMGVLPTVREKTGESSPAEDFQIEFPKAFELPDDNTQGSVSPEILSTPTETTQFAAASNPAPAPVASQEQKQTASASELFPFDPTLAAIERRQNAKQGIMSVT